MALSYGSLVKEAIVLLDKFSAGRQCLDDFIEDASKDLQNMDAPQKKFILDVVSGCGEHKNVLDVVVNVFYGQKGRWLSRGDRSQFVIICYLATFVLHDIGLQHFSNIVKSLDGKKMYMFLNFFFTNLTIWIQEEWNNIYDAAYVEEQWIGPLLRWRPDIDVLMGQLSVRITGGSRVKKAPIKTTEPQEFCLTKPKPRPLPMPELIPQQEKCKPVPNSTYNAPKEAQTIEEIKQKNHQKTEANVKQFRCGNPQKSEHSKVGIRVMSQIKEDRDAKLQFNSFQSSGLPPSNKTSNWSTKLNSAAILRQGALYNRQVEEELQRLDRLAKGEFGASSFLQWQQEMREKDLLEELVKIEHRHRDGCISYKEAAMARTHLMERKQKTAQLKKEETAQLMRRYAEELLQEEKELRDLVQQVAEGHKNSKAAKEKLHEFKQSIVKEVAEQSRALLRQALEEAQAELSRKFEIIREIRAIESIPHSRVNDFDDTETARHQLLGEMSLAELKERLQEKREQILEEKQSKKQLLLEQMDTINLRTRALAQATRKTRLQQTVSLRQTVLKDPTLMAQQKKLEEQQKEWQRLKQIKSNKAKTAEHTKVQAGTHNKVSTTIQNKDELTSLTK
uniref:Cilia-and flagella-associated protein 99 n=1 Tax=Scophthalmus maximus TaxID=52904 RepID=A0A8D2ZL28_SCOMX